MRKFPRAKIPPGFELKEHGIYWRDEDVSVMICQPLLHIVAYTHNEDDANHGRLLMWKSALTGVEHQWAMPMHMLAGEAMEIRKRLLDEGMILAPSHKAEQKFLEYLQLVKPGRKLWSLSRPGWQGESFALPDVVFPENGDKILQAQNHFYGCFKTSGTLESWKNEVACYATGNSRLIFALSTAFAAPLLMLANEESGAVHYVGGSSIGKTAAACVACSVWGGGGENGFLKTWRTTGNALEAIAEAHRDCLLPLDELGQVEAKAAGEIMYMLSGNQGKGRMKSNGALRAGFAWRIMVISTGEITLEEKMAEAQKKPHAGMEVRFVSIPADAGKGHGLFDQIPPSFVNGDGFARYLKDACSNQYGTAIRAFLRMLVGNTPQAIERIVAIRQLFLEEHLPKGANGQVSRVAGRFGLIAAAGEIAIEWDILPLQKGDSLKAAAVCFKAWLDARGTTGAQEVQRGMEQLRDYLHRHGDNKFALLTRNQREPEELIRSDERGHHERMGWRELIDGQMHYYITTGAFKEICKGSPLKDLLRELHKRGAITPDAGGKYQINKRLPQVGQLRVYHILPAFLADAEEPGIPSVPKSPKPQPKYVRPSGSKKGA